MGSGDSGELAEPVWSPCSSSQALFAKNWADATKQKQIIEQKQRDKAAKRKADNEELVPLPDVYITS